MLKKYVILSALLLSTVALADEPKELYMPNIVGGYLVLTAEPCTMDKVKDYFKYSAYETNEAGERNEGCWFRPDVKDAPDGFISFVNVAMVECGKIVHNDFQQCYFSPKQEKWTKYPKHCKI